MSESPCVFCALIAGQTTAEVVLDTPQAVGFLDVRPVFKGHVLVCTRAHVGTLTDLPGHDIPTLFEAVQQVAAAMQSALGAQGSFVAVNNTVSQSVPHLHVHVVPRTKGDGLRGFFWPRQRYEEGEMAQYAARLRAVLNQGRDEGH